MTARPFDGRPTEQAVEILAGTPPGGGQDRAARALARSLVPLLPAPPLVTNLPGRGGGNAWDELASTPGDPYRLSISSPTLVTNRLLGAADLDDRDLTPIALLCTEYIAFAVPASGRVAHAHALLERLASPPLPVTALATARGNVNHIALARIGLHLGLDPASLPVRVFDSARQAVEDVLVGNSELAAVSAASILPEVGDGSLQVLAISAPARLSPPLHEAPTWGEVGVPCSIGTWRGVVAPAAIDEEAARWWDDTIARGLESGEWREALERHRWLPTHLRLREVGAFLERERAVMGASLAALGLTVR